MTLDDAIATLYAREINCGCETFWDGGIKVWIGDMIYGSSMRRYGIFRRCSNRHAALPPQSHASSSVRRARAE